MGEPVLGRRLMALLNLLASHSDEQGRLTRLYLSAAHKSATRELTSLMQAAGLSVSIDALGTLTGRYEGIKLGAPALLIGSHIDTVRNAGRYDGTLGVLAGLVALEVCARNSERFRFAVEIIAFGDEEGIRFPKTLLGSRSLAGRFDISCLDMTDAQGISLRQALMEFGSDLSRVTTVARSPQSVVGYIEPHIEQGPVLEAANLAVGVVTGIAGAKRVKVNVMGESGHAGTVPMNMRRDALAGAAEMILAIEETARMSKSVVATVGQLDVQPGAVNVVPGTTSFTIDIRAANDNDRDQALTNIEHAVFEIAARREIEASIMLIHEAPATLCSTNVIEGLKQSVQRQGLTPITLASGAGHDAMALAPLCPIGMLFVRCKKGISHNPLESISDVDADVCVHVLLDYIRNFSPSALSENQAL